MKLLNIIWKLNRLSSMGITEILYRLKTYFTVKFMHIPSKNLYIKNDTNRLNTFLKGTDNLSNLSEEFSSFFQDNNSFELYGATINFYNIEWNKDYIDGHIYPTDHISKINLQKYSNKEVKNVLEMHRLSFLIDLSLQYKASNNKEYLENICLVINSWYDKNPFPYGMSWVSPTIVAKRVISFIFLLNILNNDKNEKWKFTREKIFQSIDTHILLISKTLSLFSSGNNHLTAELVSIFVALKTYEATLTPNGIKLLKNIGKKLNELIIKQNQKDGKNKESAFGYQYQVTDWFFLAYLSDCSFGEKRLTNAYEDRLHKMFIFFRASFDYSGNFIDYGDRDNFTVFPFPAKSSLILFTQMLRSGAIIFNDTSLLLKKHNNELDLRNKMIFTNKEFSFPKLTKTPKKQNKTFCFSDSGHISSNFIDNFGNDVYFHFRSGQFGYLSIAAHSHSDLNSFYLSINGKPVFIDPGTYCYRKDPNFRNYLRSTIAHNTVSIGKQNHAVSYGVNHWHNKASLGGNIYNYSDTNAQLKFSSKCSFPDGSIHVRHIIIHKKKFTLNITDEIQYNKKCTAQLAFHIHPDLKCHKNSIHLTNNKILEINSDLKLKSYIGQKTPELYGWYSPDFSQIQPTQTLIGQFDNNISITTKIILKETI